MERKKKPKPVKPSRQEWRAYPGSAIRVTLDAGAPVPRFLQQMIVKQMN